MFCLVVSRLVCSVWLLRHFRLLLGYSGCWVVTMVFC